ncbi:DUF721 domain-containing protein [Wolbachia endosymbiont of Dirofilaria (Dirofilaria) immitis]|uniref:DUF721 domain-containing protein n=1 Tax=Wolbachia endosymbiont of Dirofilaria (Dirofilaria) immitis TaxID=1812115 RepID=UPI00158C80F2|nr:DUF721 domain-containing protein [Wolbachia endosymbiont of Dirofilaria (Dirofilaria) immitis]QKX02362.1 DUF721 domain-containing protein [Wolbachia endosymbiont of Dirofilaria (Dirofilaria) immitis]
MLKHSNLRELKSVVESYALKCMKGKMSKNEICLILNWRSIVGVEIAECTKPKKISYVQNVNTGVVYLTVINGGKALEIQHMTSLMIERITVFFGYKAVFNIKIRQESVDYFTI